MSFSECFVTSSATAVPIRLVDEAGLSEFLASCSKPQRHWIESQGFAAEAGTLCLLPDADGNVAQVLLGTGDQPLDGWSLAPAAEALPPGDYYLEGTFDPELTARLKRGWGLAGYRFRRYREDEKQPPRLVIGESAQLVAEINALYRVRDLINTAPNDMMPEHLAAEAHALATRHGAECKEIAGEELLAENFPTIHMVGRASAHAPRLIDLHWGDSDSPRVTLVGKGVCFDTGGLDLKPANAMRLMQKDMGGAAHVLGLAEMIMAEHLPVRLRVLIPAVDNAVSGDAFRPGDVVKTRQGLTVEIDNTDAEGRLVLCDALTAACEENPDLVIDFATLTGAARAAVGTGIAAFFSNRDKLADALMAASPSCDDPVWRLPLHQSYNSMLKSRSADLVNSASSPYAGAIVAALFLQRFVDEGIDWLHFDMMAWNVSAAPGRPEGGEAMGVRAAFEVIRTRYPRHG